jgi:thioredoxin 1
VLSDIRLALRQSVRAETSPNHPAGTGSPFGEQSMSMASAVTDENFEGEIEKHSGLAVVDFWAAWCGPCRIIAPILDQLATEYSGRAKVAKLDVDANIRTATRFNVRSIPMVIFFKDGKVVDQVIGAVPRPVLEEKFKKHAA